MSPLYTIYRKNPNYHVLTVGSSSLEEQRCIGLPVPSPSVENFISGAWLDHDNPPVVLHDCLHWYTGSYHDNERKLVVFDTVDESFRCMPSPVAGYAVHLCQMDGTLCIRQLDRDTMIVQVWVLQDYEKEVWSLKHKIQLAKAEMTKYVSDKGLSAWNVVSDNGDMVISGRSAGLLFHCDSKGKLVDKFQKNSVTPEVLQLSLKESLVRHAFFERKGRKRVKVQSFFRGL
uniref:Uncharacterized protein n=1 Tax=Avena sativa TaxID=4498 RepID=A0ACD5TRN8_AVESA